jgi:hypothetical protein
MYTWLYQRKIIFRLNVNTVHIDLLPTEIWTCTPIPFSSQESTLPYPNHNLIEASWNVMAHAQKPDFVFRRNGRVHLNGRGHQFNRLLAAEVCATAFIVGINVGYTIFRGSDKSTGYPLHSRVSLSFPLPCVTVCHHIQLESTTLRLQTKQPQPLCSEG